MGTNFYLEGVACSQCGHVEERRHIGKRSAGWVFLLHVRAPDELFEHEGEIPQSLAGWRTLFSADDMQIVDEYDKHYTAAAMLLIIDAGLGKRHPQSSTTWPMHELPYDHAFGAFS